MKSVLQLQYKYTNSHEVHDRNTMGFNQINYYNIINTDNRLLLILLNNGNIHFSLAYINASNEIDYNYQISIYKDKNIKNIKKDLNDESELSILFDKNGLNNITNDLNNLVNLPLQKI